MKNIEKMTDLEILSLTDDDVENLVKVAKMEAGVKLMEKPIEPKYEEVPNKDMKFYGISEMSNICFKSLEEAQKLSEEITNLLKTALYKGYNDYPKNQKSCPSYHRDYFNPTVKVYSYFSPEVAEVGETINKRNSVLRKKYEEEEAEYIKYSAEVKEVVESVWNKVSDTRSKYSRLRNLRDKLTEYKNLAENEKDAITFFLKAYSVTDEELVLIKEGDLGDKKKKSKK
jgi:hypothetical protein